MRKDGRVAGDPGVVLVGVSCVLCPLLSLDIYHFALLARVTNEWKAKDTCRELAGEKILKNDSKMASGFWSPIFGFLVSDNVGCQSLVKSNTNCPVLDLSGDQIQRKSPAVGKNCVS